MKNVEDLTSLFQHHIDEMSVNLHEYKNGTPFVPPFIEKKLLIKIIELCITMLVKDQTVMNIEAPCVIVGDLHGHILDLYNIIVSYGLPPSQKYLFLGDIVDKGNHSLECISFIYLLKVFFPEHIFIVRGNHEMPYYYNHEKSATDQPTLHDEIMHSYCDPEVYTIFTSSFSYMPIAARIGKIFCVHGGINKKSLDLKDLENIKRPIYEMNDDIEGYLWSDPREHQKQEFTNSHRGLGYYFNEQAFEKFMKTNKLTMFIRGHEFANGPKSCFDGRLMTVFSASNYKKGESNVSTCVYIDKSYNKIIRVFDPLEMPQRVARARARIQNILVNEKKEKMRVEATSSHKNLTFFDNQQIFNRNEQHQHDADFVSGTSLKNSCDREKAKRVRCASVCLTPSKTLFSDQIYHLTKKKLMI